MLFTNAYSLYSVLFTGKGLNDIKTFFELQVIVCQRDWRMMGLKIWLEDLLQIKLR